MSSVTTRTPSVEEVRDAAHRIVDAFSNTDTAAYFAGFAPDASFVFHPESARLDSREAYETLWASWIADGWSVVSCRTTDELVQVYPGGGLISHTVHTTVNTGAGEESYVERESIVFRVDPEDPESLTAIHEHLSAPTHD